MKDYLVFPFTHKLEPSLSKLEANINAIKEQEKPKSPTRVRALVF